MVIGSKRRKSARNRLQATLDGKPFNMRSATDVFVDTICSIGLERVAELQMTLSGAPLVSRTREARTYRQCGDWFVATHSSTAEKHSVLERIAQRCPDIRLEVRVVSAEEALRALEEEILKIG